MNGVYTIERHLTVLTALLAVLAARGDLNRAFEFNQRQTSDEGEAVNVVYATPMFAEHFPDGLSGATSIRAYSVRQDREVEDQIIGFIVVHCGHEGEASGVFTIW